MTEARCIFLNGQPTTAEFRAAYQAELAKLVSQGVRNPGNEAYGKTYARFGGLADDATVERRFEDAKNTRITAQMAEAEKRWAALEEEMELR